MIALGLLILAAAGITAAVGFLSNDGVSNNLARPFDIFGYDFTDSSGRLFLFGVVVGVVGMLGLGLLLKGMRRRVRHSVDNRRERKHIKGEAESLQAERDRLAQELEEERARVAALEQPSPASDTRIVAADTDFLEAERPQAPVTERLTGAIPEARTGSSTGSTAPTAAPPAAQGDGSGTWVITPDNSGWSTPSTDATETDRDSAGTGGRRRR